MSLDISNGSVYQILTRYHPGGFVSLGINGTDGLHLANETSDDSEKWIFNASNETGFFRIESFLNRSSFVAGNLSVIAQDVTEEPMGWFLQQNTDLDPGLDQSFNYHICTDSSCSLYWIPSGYDTDSPVFSTDVSLGSVLRQGNGFEVWNIRLAEPTSISTTSTTSSVSTSMTSSIPISMSAGASAPSQTTSPGLSPSELEIVKRCKPCGPEDCVFSASGNQLIATYNMLIGQPVYNCAKGHNESSKTTLGGTFELATSWSIEVQTDTTFGLLGPRIKTSTSTGEEETVSQTQSIEVSIPPGLIGGLVANITYSKTLGQATLGKTGTTIALVAVEPQLVLGYSVVYSDCSDNFHALNLPERIECPDGGGQQSLYRVGISLWASLLVTVLGIYIV
ncbi:hypothetical protein BKA70DRAFT_1575437 [Coprinopsis sp. MPI-PUGE-AT-0042]|nr:hypothetical protein BKA70DRAFT_1575437 [Coprinopsis sp. MPI-PUGE-AT-0042]